MNILVSMLFVKTGSVGGAENMLYNLIRGLMCSRSSLVLVAGSPEDICTDFRREIANSENIDLTYTNSSKSRFLQEQLLAVSSQKFDCIIFPNYFCPPLVRSGFGKVVTIIHDLQYRHLPENFPLIKRVWLSLCHKIALIRSDKIVTISNFVRDDMLDFYGDSYSQKITTIHNPIDWERFDIREDFFNRDRKYILSVAAHYPHKNLATLIRAYDLIKDLIPDYELLLVGQFSENLSNRVNRRQSIEEIIRELDISKRVKALGFLSDAELGLYYSEASVFVFPSLFEGFGMPAVEALGFGIPVITTKCGSLYEVTQGKALYVNDPLDINELASMILRVVALEQCNGFGGDDAISLRELYSPQHIAEQYLQLIER